MAEPSTGTPQRQEPAESRLVAEKLSKLVSYRRKLEQQQDIDPDRPVISLLEREFAKRRSELAGEAGLTDEEVDRLIERELESPEDELVPLDDRVIGVALRWSLVAVAVIAVGFAGVLLFRGRPEPEAPTRSLEAEPPRTVENVVQPPALPFTDIAGQAGITFVHANGATGEKLLPETMGGGVAVLDYDNDGDQDLFFVNSSDWPWNRHGAKPANGARSALYANDGSGRFRDVSAEAGLDLDLYGMGVAVADVDGDGWMDLYVTAVGPNRLLANRQGRFEDVTETAGVAGGAKAWSTSAGFFDYDNDGDLDLFVCNYVQWSRQIDLDLDFRLTGVGRAYGPPQNYQGAHPYLYRNEGGFSFTDVSAESGIQIANVATGVPVGKALALAPIDIDRDGWTDLLVANDTVRNFFFHNQGDGTFEEVAEIFGLAYDRDGNATGAMGIDVAHHNNDGNLAFAIGNFANEMSSLFVTQDDPTFFADESMSAGIGAASRRVLTFGLFLFDVDLDGRLDLLQANGHIEDQIERVDASQSFRQPSQLFWNGGPDRGFILVEPGATGALATPVVGRGAAYGDLDGDGDLDAVVTQVVGRPLVLRNDQDLGHHWLRLRLVDRPPNRNAVGAWVEVSTAGLTQSRQVMPTRSYLSQVELPVTFGLGEADSIDALTITWPDGTRQVVEAAGLEIDRLHVIERQP